MAQGHEEKDRDYLIDQDLSQVNLEFQKQDINLYTSYATKAALQISYTNCANTYRESCNQIRLTMLWRVIMVPDRAKMLRSAGEH
jgi:hypothetical protein